MDPSQRRSLAFALTLAGGLVLIAGALLVAVIFSAVGMGVWSEGGFDGHMPWVIPGLIFPLMLGMMILVPLGAGIAALVAARGYGKEGRQPHRNGMIAVVAGALGLIGGGGGFLGAGLVVVGGVLMITEADEEADSQRHQV